MTQTTANGRKIKHLWLVEDVPARGDRDAKSFWTKIGVAFENKDGSYALHLAAIPVSGRLQMRDPAPVERDAGNGSFVPAGAEAVA